MLSLVLYISRKKLCAFYIKIVFKNDLKTTQNPRKQSPEGALKKVVLKIFPKLAEKYLCQSLFLIKLEETPSQVFPPEFGQIFKNTSPTKGCF